ncbi:alpha/beta fold hydrolase [Balneolales bacterium ANBcel1]|nr:alpha/beta fold hydrolase [Balneolales bacterium ANBcel1]
MTSNIVRYSFLLLMMLTFCLPAWSSSTEANHHPAELRNSIQELPDDSSVQELRKRAWMGTQFESDPPEQDEAPDGTGVAITGLMVVEVIGGTGERIGLKPGDRLVSVNATPTADMSALQAILSQSREGDPVKAVIVRDGEELVLEDAFASRGYETHPGSEVIYTSAPFRDGLLRVIINKPPGETPMPAMLFIPGYTCTSIEYWQDNHPYKRILDAYVEAGYVTLRIEKSGLGDSWNTPECESTDLLDEVENFEQGLKKLKTLPYVDPSRIIIYGHSMGGVIAPALSARYDVAGVIVYGTSALSWFEYMTGLARVQNQLAGMDPITHEQSVVDRYELNYRFFIKGEALEELAADPRLDSLLQSTMGYDGGGRIYGRNAEYWRQIQDEPHLENWRNTTAQVLVQFGESDFQAYSLSAHEQIVRTVNYFHPGNATLMVYPLTDHYFAKSGTMQEAYDKLVGGHVLQLFDEYNPEVGKSIIRWSNEVIGK